MRMLKGDSNAMNFEQLMAQATQVTKQQDASLIERARKKRREEEERRRRELKLQREREEAEALLAKKRELQEKKQKILNEQKKQQKDIEKKRNADFKAGPKSRTAASGSKSAAFPTGNKKGTVASFFPEKKKPVHMSFEDLMKTAKEQSMAKKPDPTKSTAPRKYSSFESHSKSNDNTPSLYHKQKKPELSKSTATSGYESSLSARERLRIQAQEPPKKINAQKRDRRSIEDVQRDIRRSKGNFSDDEESNSKRGDRHYNSNDPRLISNKKNISSSSPTSGSRLGKRPPSPDMAKRRRPLSPPQRPVSGKRPPIRRMPFSGRPLDARSSRPFTPKRRPREDEEEDEELADFVVDDEEDYGYARGPRRNSYSDEISKIFKYDKSRYANEPVYSDDDMEANTSEVLREEKRSERIARREDLIEEQKELERLKRKKKGSV